MATKAFLFLLNKLNIETHGRFLTYTIALHAVFSEILFRSV